MRSKYHVIQIPHKLTAHMAFDQKFEKKQKKVWLFRDMCKHGNKWIAKAEVHQQKGQKMSFFSSASQCPENQVWRNPWFSSLCESFHLSWFIWSCWSLIVWVDQRRNQNTQTCQQLEYKTSSENTNLFSQQFLYSFGKAFVWWALRVLRIDEKKSH